MICYSDREASIFSQRERTNNEAGKTEGDNKETSGEQEGKRHTEGERGGVKPEGELKPAGCC